MKEFSLEEYQKNPDREVVTRYDRKVTEKGRQGNKAIAVYPYGRRTDRGLLQWGQRFRCYLGISEDVGNKLSSNLQGHNDRPDRHARTL